MILLAQLAKMLNKNRDKEFDKSRKLKRNKPMHVQIKVQKRS